MREIWYAGASEQHTQAYEPCSCTPLFPLQREEDLDGKESKESERPDSIIPVAPVLKRALQTALADHFHSPAALSILLFHISQFEHIQMPLTSPQVHKRLIYHASARFLEQVIQVVCRVLRASDPILVDERGTGAALLFPQVDLDGIARIAERVSHSIKLLQAETVIPPLQFETEIVLGFGSYPHPASTLEELLTYTGQVQESILFRPAVLPRIEQAQPEPAPEIPQAQETRLHEAKINGIPFMQIPSRLPARLKQVIPHSLALELRCAPVGRDRKRLTVAMANPVDTWAIGYLREATGMTIYPVSCEMFALDTLLASGW